MQNPKQNMNRINFLILEKFHLSISKLFRFTFTSRSRFSGIFISLSFLDLDLKSFFFTCTSRKKWMAFLLHFHFSIVQNPLSQDTVTMIGNGTALRTLSDRKYISTGPRQQSTPLRNRTSSHQTYTNVNDQKFPSFDGKLWEGQTDLPIYQFFKFQGSSLFGYYSIYKTDRLKGRAISKMTKVFKTTDFCRTGRKGKGKGRNRTNNNTRR